MKGIRKVLSLVLAMVILMPIGVVHAQGEAVQLNELEVNAKAKWSEKDRNLIYVEVDWKLKDQAKPLKVGDFIEIEVDPELIGNLKFEDPKESDVFRYEKVEPNTVRATFQKDASHNIGGRFGWYAQVSESEEYSTITIGGTKVGIAGERLEKVEGGTSIGDFVISKTGWINDGDIAWRIDLDNMKDGLKLEGTYRVEDLLGEGLEIIEDSIRFGYIYGVDKNGSLTGESIEQTTSLTLEEFNDGKDIIKDFTFNEKGFSFEYNAEQSKVGSELGNGSRDYYAHIYIQYKTRATKEVLDGYTNEVQLKQDELVGSGTAKIEYSSFQDGHGELAYPIKITKTWKNIDENELPDSIKAKIVFEEGLDSKEVELNAENNWTYTGFEKDKPVIVTEVGEENYLVSINEKTFEVSYEDQKSDGEFEIINKLIVEEPTVEEPEIEEPTVEEPIKPIPEEPEDTNSCECECDTGELEDKIKELEDKIKELEDKLKELEKEIEELENTIKDLEDENKEVDTPKEELEDAEDKKDQITNEIEKKEEELQEKEEELEKKEDTSETPCTCHEDDEDSSKPKDNSKPLNNHSNPKTGDSGLVGLTLAFMVASLSLLGLYIKKEKEIKGE